MADLANRSACATARTILNWRGTLTHDAFVTLWTSIEHLPQAERPDRRVCRVMIEMLQNVTKHASSGTTPHGFIIRRRGLDWHLTTHNTMECQHAPRLAAVLTRLNELDSCARRNAFRHQLRNIHRPATEKHDLGLHYIARWSSGKLGYRLTKLSDGHQLFTLTAVVQPAAGGNN